MTNSPEKVQQKKEDLDSYEASDLLGVSRTTLYRFIHRGWIPYARKGKDFFIKKTAITKAQFAMQIPGAWHKRIEWTADDMFTVDNKNLKQNESTKKKSTELFLIAKKLKTIGENDLASQTALRAVEFM